MTELSAEQVRRLREVANRDLAASERGREWLRVARRHRQELIALYAGQPGTQEHLGRAAARVAALLERGGLDERVDDRTADDLDATLERLGRRAGPDLGQALTRLRADVGSARGRSLREAISGAEH